MSPAAKPGHRLSPTAPAAPACALAEPAEPIPAHGAAAEDARLFCSRMATLAAKDARAPITPEAFGEIGSFHRWGLRHPMQAMDFLARASALPERPDLREGEAFAAGLAHLGAMSALAIARHGAWEWEQSDEHGEDQEDPRFKLAHPDFAAIEGWGPSPPGLPALSKLFYDSVHYFRIDLADARGEAWGMRQVAGRMADLHRHYGMGAQASDFARLGVLIEESMLAKELRGRIGVPAAGDAPVRKTSL